MLFQDLLHNGNEETRAHLRLRTCPSPCLTTLDTQSPGTKRTRLPRGQQYEPAPFHSTDNQTVTGHGTSATQSRRNLSGSAGFLPRTAPSRSRGPAAQCHRRPNTAPRKARRDSLLCPPRVHRFRRGPFSIRHRGVRTWGFRRLRVHPASAGGGGPAWWPHIGSHG